MKVSASAITIGVLILGLLVAAALLLYRLSHLQIHIEHDVGSPRTTLRLRGSATFLRLPDIADSLSTIAPDRELQILLDDIDHMGLVTP